MAEDIRKVKDVSGIKEFNAVYQLPDCVVLDSAYCSMGRMIGFKACQISGYTYYDANMLLELVPQYGVSKDDVDLYEQKLRTRSFTVEELQADEEFVRLSKIFDEAVDIALSKGRCLIHDRVSKEEVLAKGYSCVSAMTYATDIKAKIVKARTSPIYENVKDDSAVIAGIAEEDMIRRNWKRGHSKYEWGCLETYDMALNSDAFGRDFTAELLASLMKR
ncbi:MAG: hypothetical protein IKG53_11010 [Solobacterium sp.]|nr:hypothetical protein [Solobacterium sp.]